MNRAAGARAGATRLVRAVVLHRRTRAVPGLHEAARLDQAGFGDPVQNREAVTQAEPSPQCDKARIAYGLDPLTLADWRWRDDAGNDDHPDDNGNSPSPPALPPVAA